MSLIICPNCNKINKNDVEIYNIGLRKQNLEISPIVPTCKICGAEINFTDRCDGGNVVVLNGASGSGKSTVATELWKKHGFYAIDGDCLIQALKHRLKVDKAEYNSDEMLEEIGREIDFLRLFTDKIVLAHIILAEDEVRYKQIFEMRGMKYKFILLNSDLETLNARCQTRTCHAKPTPEFLIKYFRDRLDFSERDGVFVLDNATLSIDEAVEKVLEICNFE